MSSLIRINREHDDSRRAWLVGHPGATVKSWTHVEAERRTITRLQQASQGVSWPQKTFEDSKNQALEISASGVRNFGSELLAFRYKNSLSAEAEADQPHPWSGDVVVRLNTGADTFEEVMLPDAVVALDPIIGGGQSLQLGYNIKAPYVQPHRTGVVNFLSATAPDPASVSLRLYGEPVTGDFTDAVAVFSDTLTISLPIGTLVSVTGIDNISSDTLLIIFEVVTPGGSASGGHSPINYPFEHNLAAVAAAYAAASPLMSAELVDDGVRPYVRISWLEAPAGAVADCKISVVVNPSAAIYEAETTAATTPPDKIQRLTIGGAGLLVDVET